MQINADADLARNSVLSLEFLLESCPRLAQGNQQVGSGDLRPQDSCLAGVWKHKLWDKLLWEGSK